MNLLSIAAMRVSEAFHILDRNIPRLEMPPYTGERLHDGQQGHKYEGMTKVIGAVDQLSRVPGLEAECAALRRTTFFRSEKDAGTATPQDWHMLLSMLEELKKIALRIHAVVASMVESESPNSIAIKLPNVERLDDLKRLVGELQLALERPVQLVLHEHLRLDGMDRGSMWLILAASATFVVKFTFGLLLAANHYMKKQAELDRYLEATKTVLGLNDYMGTVEAANAKMLEALGDSLAKQLLEGKVVDGEAVSTTVNAIRVLADLRRQGLEMQLAANAPKEVKSLYEQFVLRDLGVGDIAPKLPPQLTAGSEAVDAGADGNEPVSE